MPLKVLYYGHPSAMIFCPEEFSSTPELQQKLIDYAGGCVQPCFGSFEDKFWMEF